MKGSAFYGHGGSSPLKVSDEAVVAAQDKLDKVELGYRTPGWASALSKVFGGGGGKKAAANNSSEGEKMTPEELTNKIHKNSTLDKEFMKDSE